MPITHPLTDLLLSYCANVCFYLMLKAEGKSVRNHPVIEVLVRLRNYMERIRPIDAKIKYQIDKLLKAGSTPGKGDGTDALRLKPNPAALGAAAEGEEEEEEGEEEDKADAKYRPPKLAPAFFEENGA